MGKFEMKVISQLSSLPNIAWCLRNGSRGKGFSLNGFMNSHYPDFILCTKSDKILLVESKGDHLGNEDSAAKARLGREWQQLCGTDFRYFMVFDKLKVEGANTLGEARMWIGEL